MFHNKKQSDIYRLVKSSISFYLKLLTKIWNFIFCCKYIKNLLSVAFLEDNKFPCGL